jgi:PIN domain nuclease of toxin-antitoxin system
MKILLDTHIFLWYITGDERLPPPMLPIIRAPANEVYLSVISVWEIIIQCQLGKLLLPQSPATYLPQQRQKHGFESLMLDEESLANLDKLPPLHKDPFDRMLLCQALRYGLTIFSTDNAVRAYSSHISIVP